MHDAASLADSECLAQQLDFLIEIDRLKEVWRQSYLTGGRRRENSAEHCWHVAVMALVLAEHAAEPVDPARAACMLLVHDIVEIDAGDTYCYDREGAADKAERERRAAERIFGLLPQGQAGRMRALWEEFETGDSPEARFARALDRLMPLLHNFQTRGKSWQEHGIRGEMVLERNRPMREGSPGLWEFARSIIEEAIERGYLAR